MFKLESEMSPIVQRWLTRRGLEFKPEFSTPWGKCDFVGVEFNVQNLKLRRESKQFRKLASISQAAILFEVPFATNGPGIQRSHLHEKFSILERIELEQEISRLAKGNFVSEDATGVLTRTDHWFPLHSRVVAVELKLKRIKEAMQQAKLNQGFATESYVAFPIEVAKQINAARHLWSVYFDLGIGLIGVSRRGCVEMIPSSSANRNSEVLTTLCVERFFNPRSATTSNSTLAARQSKPAL